MSVLDNIEVISVSESEGYGGVNEDFFAVLKDDEVTSAFEEMMHGAKGRKVGNRKAPDFDLLIQYEDGGSHLLHLHLGEEGEESSMSYVGHDDTAYFLDAQETNLLRKWIYKNEGLHSSGEVF